MSVTVRPYRNGGWEVDITFRLPNGQRHRERSKAPSASKSAATRWGHDRERHLLQHGLAEPKKEVPTLQEFAPRLLEDAQANRQKPSSIAAKETILRVHLIPALGDRALDSIGAADIQALKVALGRRSAKTVNNVLAVLSVMLRKAVEWGVIERQPCRIKLLPAPTGTAKFHDFDSYERLVSVALMQGTLPHLAVLLGGDAGLRCGELMALEWSDIDLVTRRLCVARAEWKGRVTVPKGGRIRHVPLTHRLTQALAAARRESGKRVLTDEGGRPLTQRAVQGLILRVSRAARVPHGVHVLRHTFCSHLAMRGAPARAIQELAGHRELATTQRYMHLSPAEAVHAIRLLETGLEERHQVEGQQGEMLETKTA